MTKIERHKTGDMPRVNNAIRSVIENNSYIKWFFKVIGVFGVALLLAGTITPPPSISHSLPSKINRWGPYTCTVNSRCYSRVEHSDSLLNAD